MGEIEIRDTVEMREGAGAAVRRLMPVSGFMNFDPFVLMDHFSVIPGAGFPDHPHRGFEAITYLFSGTMQHADNLGNRTRVGPGGAQRFTAGRGLVHSEMPDEAETSRGIQLWINLPRRLKGCTPDYRQTDASEIPESLSNGVRTRTIVGEGSPVTLHTPARYLDLAFEPAGRFTAELPDSWRGFVYVVAGGAALGGVALAEGRAGLFDGGGDMTLDGEAGTRCILCAGAPHGEPIRQHGPFVD